MEVQNNDFSNAVLKNSTGINNKSANIGTQKNLFTLNNKAWDKLKTDLFYLRQKMIFFVNKVLIVLFFIFTALSIVGMKVYDFDSFYNLFISSSEAFIASLVYFFANKAYYREYGTKKSEEKDITNAERFTLLAISDVGFFSLLFLILHN